MKTLYNYNAIAELLARGYHNRHIAIVMNCHEDSVLRISKVLDKTEPTLKFLTRQQKQRLFVLDKLLELKPITLKWSSNDYYYITILRFLLVPREKIMTMYKGAPQIQVSRAYRKNVPVFSLFDYTTIGVNSEEWFEFVSSCYRMIGDPTRWE